VVRDGTSTSSVPPHHERIIGATAHFVTVDLDEGSIIHQDVERISHADAPEDLVRKGRDIERRVLAEAVRLFVEERVLVVDRHGGDAQSVSGDAYLANWWLEQQREVDQKRGIGTPEWAELRLQPVKCS
jgi:methionyl-tRNA formyltransferase